ncbi:MAG: mechanosensitive ion channel domain-containing protein [Cyanobacteria bacterium P01_F01_bin.33]
MIAFLASLLVAIAIGLGWGHPVSAQLESSLPREMAPIVLDGRELFRVSSLKNFTARERSQAANANLRAAVSSSAPLEITTDSQNGLVVIRIDDTHLLTITERDLRPGIPAELQARLWARSLEQAVRQARLERLPTYVREHIWKALGWGLGAIAAHVAILWLGRQAVRWAAQWQKSGSAAQIVARLSVQLAPTLIWIGVWWGYGHSVSEWFPLLRRGRYALWQGLTNSFQSPIFSMGDRGYSILDVLILAALLGGLWIAIFRLTRWLKTRVLQAAGANRTLQDGVATTTQYLLLGLGSIAILQAWGLDLRSLAIFASVLGVGVGFGLQNIARNFISGLIILLDRPIQVGDFVSIGDLVGTVDRIGTRSTHIRTLDWVTIIVPNAQILERELINWSHDSPVSRIRIPVSVAYGSDIARVREALLDAAKSHADVLGYPPPQVWLQSFHDSDLHFDLMVWVSEPRYQFRIKSDLNYRIEVNLRRYEIEVPYPQRDIHLRSPLLEEVMTAWLGRHRQSDRELYVPGGQTTAPRVKPADIDAATVKSEEYFTPLHPTLLADRDVRYLVERMRGTGGIEICDRRFRLNLYPRCFVGTEAVEWLMRAMKTTRQGALQIGQFLLERGEIHHVLYEQPFLDGNYFYRFRADAEDSTDDASQQGDLKLET